MAHYDFTGEGCHKKILVRLSQRGPLNIFEYGSGFSMVYFSKFLRRNEIKFSFVSVDNDRVWFEKISRLITNVRLGEDVRMVLFPFLPFWEKEGWIWDACPHPGQFAPRLQEERDYIQAPSRWKMKFDLIIVDGRFRRRCLEFIPSVIKEDGIVFLHDAQKKKYHDGFKYYKFSKLVNSGAYYPMDRGCWQFWIGSQNKEVLEEMFYK